MFEKLWTSKISENEVEAYWTDKKRRCAWALLGSFEENRKRAYDSYLRDSRENLYYLLCDKVDAVEGCTIETYKNGTSWGTISDLDEDFTAVDYLYDCVLDWEYKHTYVNLYQNNDRFTIEAFWEDWLTKEQGVDIYTFIICYQNETEE